MATEAAVLPVNGVYGAGHSHVTDGNHYTEAAGLRDAVATESRPEQPQDIPKDQVAWYFVEQYYTTLSKNPEKLHLFFNKRSQFVFGVEAEKEPLCTGQKAINDRIKELAFQDCKVRVTNVDSQVSGDNIVIQVVGAMSNNSQPSRKFVQTFVLAAQTNGYFVLNDIFRYLFDEDEETAPETESPELTQGTTDLTSAFQESGATDEESEPKGLTSSTDSAAQEHDAAIVDKELEQVINENTEDASPDVAVNGTPEEESTDDAPVADVADTEALKTESNEEAVQAETPKDPLPSPAVTVKDAQKPAAPPKTAVPRTWAQLAGSNSKPSAPVATAAPATAAAAATAAAPTAAQAKPSQPQPASAPSVPATIATTPPVREPSPAEGSQEGSTGGWQAVGSDHKRQQSRSQVQPAGDSDRVRAYVRNVYADVSPEELKNTLQKFGPIPYCDINRQKNSAFVEFSTRAGFAAAVAANPHKIAGHEIFVEERRVNAFPNNRGNTRGNRQSFDGRTAGQGRGGTFNKDSSRGNFAPRARGGNATPRGRGTAA